MIRSNKVRVKYLDREDIESLGWVQSEFKGVKCYETGKCWRLTHFDGHPFLSIDIFPFNMPDSNDDIQHFRGRIKNKSELRRLMQQLGIK